MAAYVYAQPDTTIVSPEFPKAWLEKASECLWGSLCLLLFMLLGPFSAPIVLGYIFFGKSMSRGPLSRILRCEIKGRKHEQIRRNYVFSVTDRST